MSKLRAFFGLPVPAPAHACLTSAIERLREGARGSRLAPRWQTADKFHTTLKFLGWVEADRVEELWSMALVFARVVPPIRAELASVTCFGPPRRARVIVASLSDPSGALTRLASSLDAGAESLGFAREEREFRPHVTLARLSEPGNVAPWLDATALEPTAVTFRELVLYRSDTMPHGAVYSAIERLPFNG